MTVEFEFTSELANAMLALWACLDTAAHSGYRLRAEQVEGVWTLAIDKAVAGEYTTLASKAGVAVLEGLNKLQLTVAGGELIAKLNGVSIATAADGTYTTGRVGIEGTVVNTFGEVNFRVNGVLLDDLKRSEEPFSNGGKWVALAWVEDSGRCFSEEFGWVPKNERSGAYWTPAEYAAEGGGKVEVGGAISRGMVPRPLD